MHELPLAKTILVPATAKCPACQKQKQMLCPRCDTIPQKTQPVSGGTYITLNLSFTLVGSLVESAFQLD